MFNESLPIRRGVGDRRGEVESLVNIGVAYRTLGEMQKALEKYHEALFISRVIGDRRGEAITLNNIGRIYLALGDMQKALEKFNESLPISRATGDRSAEANTLYNFGLTYESLGDMTRATEKFNEALSIWRAIGGPERRGYHSAGYRAGRAKTWQPDPGSPDYRTSYRHCRITARQYHQPGASRFLLRLPAGVL